MFPDFVDIVDRDGQTHSINRSLIVRAKALESSGNYYVEYAYFGNTDHIRMTNLENAIQAANLIKNGANHVS